MNILILMVLLSMDLPEDKGILSRRTPLMFRLPAEFVPGHDRLQLNIFSPQQHLNLTLTNGLLLLSHLPTNMTGELIIESRVVSDDGDESGTSVFKVNVRRWKMAPMDAVPIKLEEDESAVSTLEEIQAIRRRKATLDMPPLPEGVVVVVPPPPPLPWATNESYREFLSRVESGRRRSE